MNVIGKALDEAYRAFDIFNKQYYDGKLPQPVITIQNGRQNNLGWFTLGKVWRNTEQEDINFYEINITANNLNRPSVNIMGTLLHEMVHYYNKLNNIRDASNNVHNKKFKQEAERVGLIVTKGKPNGWGYTECGDELKEFILNEIKPNDDAFSYFRCVAKGSTTPVKPRKKNVFKYVCPSCGLEIKAKLDAHVKCADCDEDMEMEEE